MVKFSFIKSKAVFLTFIIITSIFTVHLLVPNVQAQGSNLDLCCEKTRSGDYCRYADSSQCNNNFLTSATTCEETSFCEIGCCSLQTEGICYQNSPKASCESQGGSWSDNPQCNIQECRKGCCVLGNQYSFTTEVACQKLYEPYPDLEVDFRSDIDTEQTCVELSLSGQQGCCVTDENTCSYASRQECISLTGSSINFNNNVFCSDLNACSSCTPKDHKGCLEGKEDVYWFDSCGNQEDISEDCDYFQNTICGQDENNEFACISTNCEDSPYGDRLNGESWCEFDEFIPPTGETLKALNEPGSRHYLRSCINGKIVYDECADFRSEVCFEGETNGRSTARCAPLTKELQNITGIQRGGRFWNDISECSQASEHKKWDGEPNTKPWVDQKAIECTQQGDCGNDFNWAGEYSTGGYTNSCGREDEKEIITNKQQSQQRQQIVGPLMISIGVSLFVGATTGTGAILVGTFLVSTGGIGVLILIAVGVTLLVLALTTDIFGEDTTTRCTAQCSTWLQPSGGDNCERCTEDPNKPCTEYRCKSLGATCEIVNENTPFVACTNSAPEDPIATTISPYHEFITSGGHTITEHDNGYEINEPIPPYKRVNFGIETKGENGKGDFTRCKASNQIGLPYDQMLVWFTGSGLYLSKHNVSISLPAEATSPDVMSQTNGEFTLYVRCEDKAGNKNQDDYFIRFKILPEPDRTPPLVELVNPPHNSETAANADEQEITVYTNEPADCKYSKIDMSYEQMQFTFDDCADSGLDISGASGSNGLLYECTTTLTDLYHEQNNDYYIRCRDQPEEQDESKRNTMQESFQYTLIPSDPLEIISKEPEGEIFADQVTIKVQTASGADQGDAVCRYKTAQGLPYIEFFQTGSNTHVQLQGLLKKGTYNYFIQCIDSVGNIAEDAINFEISVDLDPPEVVSLTTSQTQVTLILDEPATCKYSNEQFSYSTEGTLAQTNSKTHNLPISEPVFIKCRDEKDNEASLEIHPEQ